MGGEKRIKLCLQEYWLEKQEQNQYVYMYNALLTDVPGLTTLWEDRKLGWG